MKFNPEKTSDEVEVSFSFDKPKLEVTTPQGHIEFDKETAIILKHLSDMNFLNPIFMIEILGGADYLLGESIRLKKYAQAIREADKQETESQP